MPVIDFHTHILPPDIVARREHYCQSDRWFGLLYANPRSRLVVAEDLFTSMEEAGVAQSVCFGFAFRDAGLCHVCNEYVLDAARRFPERLIPFAVISPANASVASREATDCLERGAMGLGELMPDGQEFAYDDYRLLDPVMEVARDYRAPTLLHVNESVGHDYPGKGHQGQAEAYRLAVHYPDNTIVLAHWGGGLPFYELMPEVRRELRNVYYDTAASIYLYEDRVFRLVADWAPHKVLLGTDYPLITQKRFLRRLRQAGLTPDMLVLILGSNAERILPWPELPGDEGA